MAANSADQEFVDTVRSAKIRLETHELRPSGDARRSENHVLDVRGILPATERQTGTRLILARDEAAPCTTAISLPRRTGGAVSSKTLAMRGPELRRFEVKATVLLSAVAGFVDTAGVVALYGLYTAHVTGGLVSVGLAFADGKRAQLLAHLAMVVVFIVAVAGTALFARSIRRRGRKPLTALLVLMTITLAVFAVVGMSLERTLASPYSSGVFVIGATAVASMAVQNTLMRNTLSGASPTTIMTGNLTQVTIDIIELAFPDSTSSSRSRKRGRGDVERRLVRSGAPLVGFILGIGVGTLLTRWIGFAGILLPTAAVAVLASASLRHETPD